MDAPSSCFQDGWYMQLILLGSKKIEINRGFGIIPSSAISSEASWLLSRREAEGPKGQAFGNDFEHLWMNKGRLKQHFGSLWRLNGSERQLSSSIRNDETVCKCWIWLDIYQGLVHWEDIQSMSLCDKYWLIQAGVQRANLLKGNFDMRSEKETEIKKIGMLAQMFGKDMKWIENDGNDWNGLSSTMFDAWLQCRWGWIVGFMKNRSQSTQKSQS